MEKDSFIIKKYYLIVILLSFALAVGTFVFFATEKNVYVSRGKFSYYFSSSSNPTNDLPFVSDAMTKSISDSIQTRAFLEKLYNASNITVSSKISSNPTKYIKTSVIEGSSVIQVSIFSENKETLSRLSQKFYTVLNSSSLISGMVPKPNINIVDPLYTNENPTYPKPLEYAGLVFIGSLLVGIMFLYIFSNEN